jgi:hypothetical protein
MMSKPLRASNHGLFNGDWYHNNQSPRRPSQAGGEPLGRSAHWGLDEREKAGPENHSSGAKQAARRPDLALRSQGESN